jgi:hypothetical protein
MAAPPPATLRVATYNILSPALIASHAPLTPMACLQASFRLASVLRQLQPECDARAVVCLQEVAASWAGPLHAFFSRQGYTFITALYGHRRNNFMGVGIAFPHAQYELLDADIACLCDTKQPRPPLPAPPPPPPPTLLQRCLGALTAPLALLLRLALGGAAPPPLPPQPGAGGSANGGSPSASAAALWDLVYQRVNQMASVRLRPLPAAAAAAGSAGGSAPSFSVSCYHMPCLYLNRALMSVHCALAGQHAHAFAAGGRYVLAGDFNIKPCDPQYRLLTRGSAQEEAPPPEWEGDTWQPCVVPLTSAYCAHTGSEPAFTNFAHTEDGAAPFVETCVLVCAPGVLPSQRSLPPSLTATTPHPSPRIPTYPRQAGLHIPVARLEDCVRAGPALSRAGGRPPCPRSSSPRTTSCSLPRSRSREWTRALLQYTFISCSFSYELVSSLISLSGPPAAPAAPCKA